MANLMDAVWAKAVVFAARWLGVVVLVVFILGRAAAASARRLGSTSAGWLPPMGQQLLDPTVQLRRQSGEHVLEVGPGLVPVELGRLRRWPNYAEWGLASPRIHRSRRVIGSA